MKVEISEEAADVLRGKMEVWSLSVSDLLDFMILDYVQSTPVQRRTQRIRRDAALRAYLHETRSRSLEKAWMDGYHNGYEDFQLRKSPLFLRKRSEK